MKLYVGTYTEPGMGRAKGVYRLDFDEETGVLSQDALFEGIVNPSYLALAADGTRMYCVHETETYGGARGGAVSGYAIGPDGATLLNTRLTLGSYPCHVTISPDGTLLAVANYGGGSLSAFAIAPDGMLGEAALIQHEGHGTNPTRQEAPHVHSSIFSPSGRHVMAADLGLDTVTAYPVRAEMVDADAGIAVAGHPGDGPRMFAYNARLNLLYVLSEMGNNIATFDCGTDGTPTQRLCSASTLPSGADTSGTAADLRLSADGRFLYASNRKHDSLTVFAVDPSSGNLTMAQNIPCGGKTPRGFTLSPSGNWLLCAHQDSDTITSFAINKEKGTLAERTTFAVPSPVCLVFP